MIDDSIYPHRTTTRRRVEAHHARRGGGQSDSRMTEIRQRQTPTTTTTTDHENETLFASPSSQKPQHQYPAAAALAVVVPNNTTYVVAKERRRNIRQLRQWTLAIAVVLTFVPLSLVLVHQEAATMMMVHPPHQQSTGTLLRQQQQQPSESSVKPIATASQPELLPRIVFRKLSQKQNAQQLHPIATTPSFLARLRRTLWYTLRGRTGRPHPVLRTLVFPTHAPLDPKDGLRTALQEDEEAERDPEEYGWDRTRAEQQAAVGQPVDCAAPEWTQESYPTCNHVHALDPVGTIIDRQQLQNDPWTETRIERLGRGHYRTSYLFASQSQQQKETVVLKQLRVQRHVTQRQLSQITREATVLGHYFRANPRFANVYAYCGGSVVVEPGLDVLSDTVQPPWPHVRRPKTTTARTASAVNASESIDDDDDSRGYIPQTELDRLHAQTKDGLYIHNRKFFPQPESKRQLAIALLESIAHLHGFPGGPILHDDVSFDQWLVSRIDGRIMLNDINMAVPMEYSASHGKYCAPPRSISGNWRAPETQEWSQSMGTVSDVWSMGALLYILLTGLNPYYQHAEDSADIEKDMLAGVLPLVDPRFLERSPIEATLARVIPEMMQSNYTARPHLVHVIQQLTDAAESTAR